MREILFYNGKAAADDNELKAMLERLTEDYESGQSINWVLADPETNQPIGTIGFYRGFHDNKGEVGYILKPEFRGMGLMREALEVITAFGLGFMELDGILAFTKPDNTPSRELLERSRYETDGIVDKKGYIRYRYDR